MRAEAIEVMAKAIGAYMRPNMSWHKYEGEHDQYRNEAAAALDALLDHLEANADETVHPRHNDLVQPVRLGDAAVEDLWAVLREDD